MKAWPCFLPSPTQDVMSYVSLHMETQVHAVSTNKVALLYYDCQGVVGKNSLHLNHNTEVITV